MRESVAMALLDASFCIKILESQSEPGIQSLARDDAFAAFQTRYQQAKSSLLEAAAAKALPPIDAGHALDALSQVRRLIDQLIKADRILNADEPDPDEHDVESGAEDDRP